MKVIYKYEIPTPRNSSGIVGVPLPVNVEILSVGCQRHLGDKLFLWALVDPDSQLEEDVRLRVFGTGHKIVGRVGKFLGTAFMMDGQLIWHVFLEK